MDSQGINSNRINKKGDENDKITILYQGASDCGSQGTESGHLVKDFISRKQNSRENSAGTLRG
jgi:hypothetical protein